jgi:hypothetical protein
MRGSALGWELIGDMPGHHKFWSALMKWAGDGEPNNWFSDTVGIVPPVNSSIIELRT